jgi:catechol 2,3-dioxygenase-like lactoylglutathione lyase family enzyme
MIRHFDHITIVVRDTEEAKASAAADSRSSILELNKVGFNHICLAVDDIDAEVRRLRAHGVRVRNEIMQFHDRKLVFLRGPEGVTVELAQWMRSE